MPLTRRRLILWTAVTALPGYPFASDFWNSKDPAEWSSAEVEHLLTKSPWAKQVTTETGGRSPMGANPGPANARYGDLTGPGESGQVAGRSRDLSNQSDDIGPAKGAAPPLPQRFKGTVRWESAKPVLDATRKSLADLFANHCVISVIGFPLGDMVSVKGAPKFSATTMEKIMTSSTLSLKGNRTITARVAQVVGDALQLGFPKGSTQLSKDDGEVLFTTTINRIAIKAKFNCKEMMYRGELAI